MWRPTVSSTKASASATATIFHCPAPQTMPMQAAYWAKAWGMGVDRYGVAWIVNGEPLPY